MECVTNELINLHDDALTLADLHVSGLRPGDMSRPTPCADWSLGELLAHMIGQHLGFARAARELTAPAEAYRPVPFEPASWAQSVRELRDAFAAADLDGAAVAVELAPTPLPISQLVAAQLLDTVVHTWDVAESVGTEFTPPKDLLAATATIAEAIPDRAFGPGRAFVSRLSAGGDTWQRTLALVGRRTDASITSSKG
jgi:uncharacterized protein (TIGR03086 family)